MLDALGVRNACIEETRKFINSFSALEGLSELANIAFIQSHPQLQDLWREECFKTHRFGDTILLRWELTDSRDELIGLVTIGRVLSLIIINGLRRGIPLRGAVSIGDIVEDDKSILGPVINDIASWYEQIEFIGVVATPQCGQYLNYIKQNPGAVGFTDEKECRRELSASFQECDVPMKDSKTRQLWVVNWTSIPWLQTKTLRWYFDQTRKLTIPFGTEHKYDNTQSFIVEMLKRDEADIVMKRKPNGL